MAGWVAVRLGRAVQVTPVASDVDAAGFPRRAAGVVPAALWVRCGGGGLAGQGVRRAVPPSRRAGARAG